MPGYLALILHAHLPYVRHPEHERFLEESWLFEAITETYVPLLQMMEGWRRDGMDTRLTFTLSPTLCAMLRDPLLQDRYTRHLEGLIDLAEKEIHRTHWDRACHALATMYLEKFSSIRDYYLECGRDLVGVFRGFQEEGRLEIITCPATHALLPFLLSHPASLRAQIFAARDSYQECFGVAPRGIWLSECAYAEGIEDFLAEAGLRWFVVDTHGLLQARPRPRYGVFAPVFLPNGVAAFGRDFESAKQVWSRHEGYPGDARYRDFYRDIGFDLDFDYVAPHLATPNHRSFTGIKYHGIGTAAESRPPYDRGAALRAADEHAGHFLRARLAQITKLEGIMDRPPLLVCPYDAELFGHWWYEGPEFLDYLVRKAHYDQQTFKLTTPSEFLREHSTHQVATPAASSWGEEGHWRAWLNETNGWIQPHLRAAQRQMSELAVALPGPTALEARALRQAGRELLLAQASDWPFILRTGSSPGYARKRVSEHLLRFHELATQLATHRIDEAALEKIEWMDNPFPNLNWRWWV